MDLFVQLLKAALFDPGSNAVTLSGGWEVVGGGGGGGGGRERERRRKCEGEGGRGRREEGGGGDRGRRGRESGRTLHVGMRVTRPCSVCMVCSAPSRNIHILCCAI